MKKVAFNLPRDKMGASNKYDGPKNGGRSFTLDTPMSHSSSKHKKDVRNSHRKISDGSDCDDGPPPLIPIEELLKPKPPKSKENGGLANKGVVDLFKPDTFILHNQASRSKTSSDRKLSSGIMKKNNTSDSLKSIQSQNVFKSEHSKAFSNQNTEASQENIDSKIRGNKINYESPNIQQPGFCEMDNADAVFLDSARMQVKEQNLFSSGSLADSKPVQIKAMEGPGTIGVFSEISPTLDLSWNTSSDVPNLENVQGDEVVVEAVTNAEPIIEINMCLPDRSQGLKRKGGVSDGISEQSKKQRSSRDQLTGDEDCVIIEEESASSEMPDWAANSRSPLCGGQNCSKVPPPGMEYCSSECIMGRAEESLVPLLGSGVRDQRQDRLNIQDSEPMSRPPACVTSTPPADLHKPCSVFRKHHSDNSLASNAGQEACDVWSARRHSSSSSDGKEPKVDVMNSKEDKIRKKPRRASSYLPNESEAKITGGPEKKKELLKRSKSDGDKMSLKADSSRLQKNKSGGPDQVRINVRAALRDALMARVQEVQDIALTKSEIKNLAVTIEEELFALYEDTSHKYRTKYRSLIFNIKDKNNKVLFHKILSGLIQPDQLVLMTTDELASQELARWREEANRHELEMIEKTEKEALEDSISNRHVIKKTHKGEVEVADEDLSILEARIQEKSSWLQDQQEEQDRQAPVVDTTDQHQAHLFDLNCKVCTGKVVPALERQLAMTEADKATSVILQEQLLKEFPLESSKQRRESQETELLPATIKDLEDFPSDEQLVQTLLMEQMLEEEDLAEFTTPTAAGFEAAPSIDSLEETLPSLSMADSDVALSFGSPEDTQSSLSPRIKSSAVLERSSSVSSESSWPPRKRTDSGHLEPEPQVTNQKVVFWSGCVSMVDVTKFSTSASLVSGPLLEADVPETIHVCGRISPDHLWEYLSKLRHSHSQVLSVVRFHPGDYEEKKAYVQLYSYLDSRGRCGVAKSLTKQIKDFYLVPLASYKKVPKVLLPFDGPGLEQNRPNMLLGVFVFRKGVIMEAACKGNKKLEDQSNIPFRSHTINSSSLIGKDPRLAKWTADEAQLLKSLSDGSCQQPTPEELDESTPRMCMAEESLMSIQTNNEKYPIDKELEAYSPSETSLQDLPYDPEDEDLICGKTVAKPSTRRDSTSTQPMAHTSTQPMAHTSTQPMAHTSTKPVDHTFTQPVVHTSTQPVAHTSTQPVAHISTKTVSYTSTKPFSHTSTQHVAHTSTKPVIHTSTKPVIHASTQPVASMLTEAPLNVFEEKQIQDCEVAVHEFSRGTFDPTQSEESEQVRRLVETMACSHDPQEVSSLMFRALSMAHSFQDQQKFLLELSRRVQERKLQLNHQPELAGTSTIADFHNITPTLAGLQDRTRPLADIHTSHQLDSLGCSVIETQMLNKTGKDFVPELVTAAPVAVPRGSTYMALINQGSSENSSIKDLNFLQFSGSSFLKDKKLSKFSENLDLKDMNPLNLSETKSSLKDLNLLHLVYKDAGNHPSSHISAAVEEKMTACQPMPDILLSCSTSAGTPSTKALDSDASSAPLIKFSISRSRPKIQRMQSSAAAEVFSVESTFSKPKLFSQSDSVFSQPKNSRLLNLASDLNHSSPSAEKMPAAFRALMNDVLGKEQSFTQETSLKQHPLNTKQFVKDRNSYITLSSSQADFAAGTDSLVQNVIPFISSDSSFRQDLNANIDERQPSKNDEINQSPERNLPTIDELLEKLKKDGFSFQKVKP